MIDIESINEQSRRFLLDAAEAFACVGAKIRQLGDMVSLSSSILSVYLDMASNNWRKMHGYPMRRKIKRNRGARKNGN